MDFDNFVSDMAVDALEKRSMGNLARESTLSYGIVRRYVNLTKSELAEKAGKEKGVYVTYDCPSAVLESSSKIRTLQNRIAETLVELVGVQGRTSKVLVVGLGNDNVTADSLGRRTVDMLDVSPVSEAKRPRAKVRLCGFSAGVEGLTGIKTADTVEGVCMKIKPSCVIVVDSLATSSATRLGTSFQLTTAGIAPASGVGGDKPRIDRSVLGVPVVAVGVPLVLSMRTVLSDFAKDYLCASGVECDEYRLRNEIAEKRLSNLVVAPKEILYYADSAAAVVAGAINAAFGENH